MVVRTIAAAAAIVLLLLLLTTAVDAQINFEPCRQETSQGNMIGGMSDPRAITAYGYVPNDGGCRSYNYYGSAGSSNRFDSMEECESFCSRRFQQLNKPNCSFEDVSVCIDYDSSRYSSSALVYYYVKKVGTCIQAVLRDNPECRGLADTNFFRQKQDCSDQCLIPAMDSMIQDRCFAVFSSEQDGTVCPYREKRYFYNEQTKQCVSRRACGTDSVSNSFASREECQKFCLPSSVEELCSLPKDPGACASQGRELTRYYYSPEQRTCLPFTYTGCHGNKNRFFDEVACRRTCIVEPATPQPQRASANNSRLPIAEGQVPLLVQGRVCGLRPSAGSCPMTDGKRLLRYFYDSKRNKCSKFKYTGCGGNGNNFETAEDCFYACQNYVSSTEPLCEATAPSCPPGSLCEAYQKLCSGGWMTLDMMQDRCQLPKDAPAPTMPPGRDTSPENRQRLGFYYDSSSFNCYQSMGRLGSGLNFFSSWTECKNYCYPEKRHQICFLPKETGPCIASLKRYYFNRETGACDEMTYGGCLGNRNRFLTIHECRKMCESQLQSNPCLFPPSHGHTCPGQTAEVSQRAMYFYSSTTKNCHQYTYYGCGGSQNLFATGEQCKSQCGARRIVELWPIGRGGNTRPASPTAPPVATTTAATTTTATTATSTDLPKPTTTFNIDLCLSQSPNVTSRTPVTSCPETHLRKVYVFQNFNCDILEPSALACNDSELSGPVFWSRTDCEKSCPMATKQCPTSSCPTNCKYKQHVQQINSNGCLVCSCFDPCEGKCPPTERCKASCSDEQCTEVQTKCLALTRPGACPPIRISSDTCERQCDFDLDCPNEQQKCCQIGCAQGRACQDPYVTSPPPITSRPPEVPCGQTTFGCCPDGKTSAAEPKLTNCPPFQPIAFKMNGTATDIVKVSGVLLSLDCGFLGVPQPIVLWLKDNRPVTQSQRVRVEGQLLMLRQVAESDSGEYECSASNSQGQKSHRIRLEVQVPAAVLGVQAPGQPLTVRGQVVQLQCETSGRPEPEISWLKNDVPIAGETASNLTLTVGPAAVGEYTCRATNSAGPPASAKVSVEFRESLRASMKVIKPDNRSVEGGQNWLQCRSETGYPTPHLYQWFKEVRQPGAADGSTVASLPLGNGLSLDLSPLKMSDSGSYFCRISNQFETVESERIGINVESKCGDVQCDGTCRYGYKKDANDCPTCQCVTPCQEDSCQMGQVCQPTCPDINDCTKFTVQCISATVPPPDCVDQDAEYCSLVLQQEPRACSFVQSTCCASCFERSLVSSRDVAD